VMRASDDGIHNLGWFFQGDDVLLPLPRHAYKNGSCWNTSCDTISRQIPPTLGQKAPS